MTQLIKIITTIATSIILLDVILMIVNGTMLYVLLMLLGLYILASLAFKESAHKVIRRWINTGKLYARGRHHHDLTQPNQTSYHAAKVESNYDHIY